MKFSISVPDLQFAMRAVKDVVPSSGLYAESAGVLLSTSDGKVVFTAFNPTIITKAMVKAEVEEDGEAVIDASSLYGAVSHFQPMKDSGIGTSDITIKSSPKAKKLHLNATTYYSENSKVPHKRVFPLRNQEFFPSLPKDSEAKNTLEMPAGVLMDGIDSVSYAISSDKHQIIFTGSLLEARENTLTLFATDGVCLAEYSAPINYSGDPVRVVLPGNFVSKVAKSFFEEDVLTVSLTETMIFARSPNLVVGGTLIREEYPDYKGIMPDPKVYASVDKHIILDNLLNISYEASQLEGNRVSVSFSNGEASLRCGSSSNGGLKTEFKGEFKFDCNLKLLANSVKHIIGDELIVGFTDSSSPITLSSEEKTLKGASLNCVLVPLS